jgi:hypothetical protein
MDLLADQPGRPVDLIQVAERYQAGFPIPTPASAARIPFPSAPAVNNAFPPLLLSRADSTEKVHLCLVGETLRQRLAAYFDSGPQPLATGEKNMMNQKSGHTERFNRVLLNWLALQNAMSRVRQGRPEQDEAPLVPWECDDNEVRRLWSDLTRPENRATLWEWLCQSATGEQEIWALQALQECQFRFEHEPSR